MLLLVRAGGKGDAVLGVEWREQQSPKGMGGTGKTKRQ